MSIHIRKVTEKRTEGQEYIYMLDFKKWTLSYTCKVNGKTSIEEMHFIKVLDGELYIKYKYIENKWRPLHNSEIKKVYVDYLADSILLGE